jgi:TRAP-type C4-dicarboxylate transport system permease small subunit
MLRLADVISRVNRILGMTSGFLILMVCFFMVGDVVARRFLGSAILWVGDINRYLLLCIVFFAVALTLQEDGHVRADIVVAQVQNTVFKSILSILASTFSLGYCGFLLWKTSALFIRSIELNMKTSSQVSIPISWLYFVIILGALLLFTVITLQIIESIFGRRLFRSSKSS